MVRVRFVWFCLASFLSFSVLRSFILSNILSFPSFFYLIAMHHARPKPTRCMRWTSTREGSFVSSCLTASLCVVCLFRSHSGSQSVFSPTFYASFLFGLLFAVFFVPGTLTFYISFAFQYSTMFICDYLSSFLCSQQSVWPQGLYLSERRIGKNTGCFLN